MMMVVDVDDSDAWPEDRRRVMTALAEAVGEAMVAKDDEGWTRVVAAIERALREARTTRHEKGQGRAH